LGVENYFVLGYLVGKFKLLLIIKHCKHSIM